MVGILLVAHALGLLSSLHALMSTRTSQGTIAWLVSLNTLPLLAVPAYWVLGRSRFQGYVVQRRAVARSQDPFVREARDRVLAFRPADPQRRVGEALAGLPYLEGSAVELLVDGPATFDSIFAGIEAAEHSVLVQFYIVHDDELGRALKQRLIDKASQGLRVYFLYDEIGSAGLPSRYVRELRDAGVRVYRYLPGFAHQKVFLVDSDCAGVGTANFDNRSFRLNFEVTGLVLDEAFASRVQAMLEDDMAHSRPMTRAEIDDKGWWFRMISRAAFLTSPVQ